MNEIQAHINNIAFPKTIDELLFFIYEHGCFNVEDILYDAQDPGFTEWTVPKWCKYGDIVLFMHSKTANATISKLRTALLHNETLFEPNVYNHLLSSISRGKQLYNKYGGKIFAMGTIGGPPCYEPSTSDDFHSVLHWKSRIYAIVDHLFCLDVPIDISEFHDFIHI